MDNSFQGDLTDIVLRASGGGHGGDLAKSAADTWQLVSNSDPENIKYHDPIIMDDPTFGDPFCNMRDPLLHELNIDGSSPRYFNCSSSNFSDDHVLIDSHDHENSKSLFSRIQISLDDPISKLQQQQQPVSNSPCDSDPVMVAAAAAASAAVSPRGFEASGLVTSEMINVNSTKSCLIDSPGSVQISSPRNLGIKRRKSQAKKVVCIPAPAAANSRPSSGEVVPSDLWAWRKYGQKPIKGSPYPRGYYRCSSSKGCSARKQVERSRTDPNMLVITYTSEHNHPWPTQRNALAGSTRSQPSKHNSNAKNNVAAVNQRTAKNEDSKENNNSNDTTTTTTTATTANVVAVPSSSSSAVVPPAIKEEMFSNEKDDEDEDDRREMMGDQCSYKPAMDDPNLVHSTEDFFADLGEIDSDPLDRLIFNHQQGFNEENHQKEMDPFSIFDWSINGNNNNASFGEANEEQQAKES